MERRQRGSQTDKMRMKSRFLFSLILDMCIVHMIYAYKESGVKKKKLVQKLGE